MRHYSFHEDATNPDLSAVQRLAPVQKRARRIAEIRREMAGRPKERA